MRLRYLWLLFCLACGTPEPEAIREVQLVTGELRYHADLERLTLELSLPDSTTRPPLFLGRLMEPRRSLPDRRYSGERRGVLPDTLTFTVMDEALSATFTPRLSPVYVDSIPDTLGRDTTVSFVTAASGLAENENLDVYFRPRQGGDTRRIVVTGPTRQGVVSIGSTVLTDVEPGPYVVYLVRHQPYRGQEGYVKVSVRTEYISAPRPVIIE